MRDSIKIILKMGGFKVFLDGSPQGRTAWMTTPYEGDDTYCGYPIHSDEKLREYIAVALDKAAASRTL